MIDLRPFFIVLAMLLSAHADKTCKGATPCTACENCHSCKWCSKGKSCGTCRPAPKPARKLPPGVPPGAPQFEDVDEVRFRLIQIMDDNDRMDSLLDTTFKRLSEGKLTNEQVLREVVPLHELVRDMRRRLTPEEQVGILLRLGEIQGPAFCGMIDAQAIRLESTVTALSVEINDGPKVAASHWAKALKLTKAYVEAKNEAHRAFGLTK